MVVDRSPNTPPRRVARFHNARIYRAYFFAREREKEEGERARLRARALARLSLLFLRFIFIGKFVVNLSGTIYRGGTLRANESDLVKKKEREEKKKVKLTRPFDIATLKTSR